MNYPAHRFSKHQYYVKDEGGKILEAVTYSYEGTKSLHDVREVGEDRFYMVNMGAPCMPDKTHAAIVEYFNL